MSPHAKVFREWKMWLVAGGGGGGEGKYTHKSSFLQNCDHTILTASGNGGST